MLATVYVKVIFSTYIVGFQEVPAVWISVQRHIKGSKFPHNVPISCDYGSLVGLRSGRDVVDWSREDFLLELIDSIVIGLSNGQHLFRGLSSCYVVQSKT